MFGFNWVDLIILLALAHAFYHGIKIGFVALSLGFGGLFAVLFIGGETLPHILPIHNQTIRILLSDNVVLMASVLVAIRGFEYGERLHIKLGEGKAHIIESAAGLILSLGSALALIWILAAGIETLPAAHISNGISGSLIDQTLNRLMPPVPDVLDEFDTLLNPNTSVRVLNKFAPGSTISVAPVPTSVPALVVHSRNSVARITSFGCNGIIDGSGFVVAPEIVVTNAHVIAGIRQPVVKIGTSSYEATPVLFDPNQDIALLRVSKLRSHPLTLTTTVQPAQTKVYAVGYPKSIYSVSPGTILDSETAIESNIYALGSITRTIYALAVNIAPGSSGGPVLDTNGRVVGMIFAQSTLTNKIAYAIRSQDLLKDYGNANRLYKRVGTGACYKD